MLCNGSLPLRLCLSINHKKSAFIKTQFYDFASLLITTHKFKRRAKESNFLLKAFAKNSMMSKWIPIQQSEYCCCSIKKKQEILMFQQIIYSFNLKRNWIILWKRIKSLCMIFLHFVENSCCRRVCVGLQYELLQKVETNKIVCVCASHLTFVKSSFQLDF